MGGDEVEECVSNRDGGPAKGRTSWKYCAAPVAAFCIKNDTKERIEFVIDTDGQGSNAPYQKNLPGGRDACCDWRKTRCNKSGVEDGELEIRAKKVVGLMEWICVTRLQADYTIVLREHSGAGGCSWDWESPRGAGGGGFMSWINDLLKD